MVGPGAAGALPPATFGGRAGVQDERRQRSGARVLERGGDRRGERVRPGIRAERAAILAALPVAEAGLDPVAVCRCRLEASERGLLGRRPARRARRRPDAVAVVGADLDDDASGVVHLPAHDRRERCGVDADHGWHRSPGGLDAAGCDCDGRPQGKRQQGRNASQHAETFGSGAALGRPSNEGRLYPAKWRVSATARRASSS